jgi:hypothetical protein
MFRVSNFVTNTLIDAYVPCIHCVILVFFVAIDAYAAYVFLIWIVVDSGPPNY